MTEHDPSDADPVPRQAGDLTHPGGMRARRVFPYDQLPNLDPFVVFERFSIEPTQGFDTHPHRGFEIVSYMLDGAMAHEDSMGHASTARPGDGMRITTGSGMQHSEMPGNDEACSGLQLWVNLPRAKKDIEPSYQEASSEDLPVSETEGATVTTVVGEGSPLDLQTDVEYHVVTVTDAWEWEVPDGWNGFVFVVAGEGRIGDEPMEPADFITVENGGSVTIETDTEVRFAAIAGNPHHEPIRQRGPYVL
ncbi:pirin family protein [Haloarchaeobius sp. DYHT-AS-18]|uniref:pirin family protein n=1 Tax=Haloarchaeobius sp. DYHT-AS-18 TaxID=3446117 RepID=UPI003EBA4D10